MATVLVILGIFVIGAVMPTVGMVSCGVTMAYWGIRAVATMELQDHELALVVARDFQFVQRLASRL